MLAVLGDSVTTDHISPAGAIRRDGPAGRLPRARTASSRGEFNTYGARRGNHEVMVRGTFANIRLRNLIGGEPLPKAAGTRHSVPRARRRNGSTTPPCATRTSRGAARRPRRQGVRVGFLARLGGEGHRLLGVRAVIAESYERIHRSNLVGMGVLPLQFEDGESAASLGLTGEELISIDGVAQAMADGGAPPKSVNVVAERPDGVPARFTARVRIDTPREAEYLRHGGILPFVLRNLLEAS